MSVLPSVRTSRRPLVVAGLAILLAAPAPLGAQGAGQSAPPMPAQVAAPPSGPAIALSMDQAVTMALETNLGLKAERLNLDVAAQSVAGARASFLPQITSGVNRSTSDSVPQDFTQGSSTISSTGLNVNGAFNQQLPWYGGRYSVSWSGSRNETIGGNSSFNPRLGSTFSVNFSQPLWRNLTIDSNRANLNATERRRAIADVQLQQRVVSTQVSVQNAYLNLIGSIKQQEVAQLNMDLAQESLKNARARVAVGVAAQIEIIQFEQAVASNQEQLILSAAQIETAEDTLRSLILDPNRPDYWQVRLTPTDEIQLTPRDVDEDAVIGTALAERLDLTVAKRNLEITDLNVRLNKNLTRPQVDLGVNYSATGTGGTQLQFGSGFPPPVLSRTDKSFGSVLSDAFGGAYPSWAFGVSVSYPLGRSAAEAALAQQQLAQQQQTIGLRDLELQIVRQVREAVRQVRTSYQRVQATQTARVASEQQLDAEQRRFAVGLSTTFELQQKQRDLAAARVNELNAMIAYNRALINLEAAQKTG
jgi:outer membrane protein